MAEEPPTLPEGRAARYRKEHEQFLKESLKPLPPLSPPPPPPQREWLGRTLWFLVTVYVVFWGLRWFFRWIASR